MWILKNGKSRSRDILKFCCGKYCEGCSCFVGIDKNSFPVTSKPSWEVRQKVYSHITVTFTDKKRNDNTKDNCTQL